MPRSSALRGHKGKVHPKSTKNGTCKNGYDLKCQGTLPLCQIGPFQTSPVPPPPPPVVCLGGYRLCMTSISVLPAYLAAVDPWDLPALAPSPGKTYSPPTNCEAEVVSWVGVANIH